MNCKCSSGSTTSTSETIQCDNIQALTEGKSITLQAPLDKLETVIYTEDDENVWWDKDKGMFFRQLTIPTPDTSRLSNYVATPILRGGFTIQDVYFLLFTNGLYGDSDYFERTFSALYMPNIINFITGDVLNNESKNQWFEYYKLISNENIGKQIFDAFMDDKEYLETYVNFIKTLISMGVDTGISSIEIAGNQMQIVLYSMDLLMLQNGHLQVLS